MYVLGCFCTQHSFFIAASHLPFTSVQVPPLTCKLQGVVLHWISPHDWQHLSLVKYGRLLLGTDFAEKVSLYACSYLKRRFSKLARLSWNSLDLTWTIAKVFESRCRLRVFPGRSAGTAANPKRDHFTLLCYLTLMWLSAIPMPTRLWLT